MKTAEENTVLQQLQHIELEIYKEVVKICDRHNLTYYMSGGTFLGAVRHKGFIPWDDDMDMYVPRDDYEKLIKILREELPEPYIVQYFAYNKNVHRYFARVENTKVKLIRRHAIKPELSNAWIDIFPLDGMPEGKIRSNLRKIHLLYLRMLMQLSVFDEIVTLNRERPWYEKLIVWIAIKTPIQKMLSWEKRSRKLDKALKSFPLSESKTYMNFMSTYKFKDLMPKSVYGKGALYQFEDAEFRGPEDYDTFLRKLFGDYMKLPPVEERNNHYFDRDSLEVLSDD